MTLGPGTRLGPYEIIGPLGTGGMGEVYKARDTRLGRAVAVKVLPAALATATDRLRRFEHEARAASALNHPNILTVFDFGQAEAGPYIAMELVEGETLRERSRRTGRLDIDEVLDVAIQVASALAAAHSAGIVHRDIKPENVMIRGDGLVKVVDLGLAKMIAPMLVDGDTLTAPAPHTAFGAVIGTAKYMSPEQARGLELDPRCDVFSFGVLVYEMLAGRLPFDGSTAAEVLVSILERDPAPLGRYRAETPAALHSIVSRCLEKDRSRRYSSAVELVVDLTNAREGISADPRPLARAPSVAVLPFANVSADPENEFFCDGLAEELINTLSRLGRLRVAARTSTFSLKGRGLDVREIGRALKVASVLEGSVRKAGQRMRIAVQLIDVTEGYPLWSERFDRQIEDIFAIQDEIALAVVDALKVKLLGDEKAALGRRHTEDVEAHQLYLRGRHHWHKWNEDGLRKAKECFERAIQIDPEYALGHLGLADVALVRGGIGFLPPNQTLPEARGALARALALDSDLAEAWVLLGVCGLHERDWAGVETAIARAIASSPRLGHAHLVLAQLRFFLGRLDEGLAAATRAVELDPLAPWWIYVLAEAYWARGEYEQALDQLRALLEIEPSFWFGHFGRGILLLAQGKGEDALRALEEAVRCSHGSPYAVGYLACALARTGDRDGAERQLKGLLERAKAGYVPALSFAFAQAGLGETERAFEWLERACDEREMWLCFHAQYDPAFADLRRDSRMSALLRRIGVPLSERG